MGRGKDYTSREDELLMRVFYDNDALSYTQVAQIAQYHGICDDRPVSAVAQHIGILLRKGMEEASQIEWPDPEKYVYKKKYTELLEKYENLIHVLIDEADLYKGPYFNGLKYNLPAITVWLKEHEPERASAKIAALEHKDLEEAANEAE